MRPLGPTTSPFDVSPRSIGSSSVAASEVLVPSVANGCGTRCSRASWDYRSALDTVAPVDIHADNAYMPQVGKWISAWGRWQITTALVLFLGMQSAMFSVFVDAYQRSLVIAAGAVPPAVAFLSLVVVWTTANRPPLRYWRQLGSFVVEPELQELHERGLRETSLIDDNIYVGRDSSLLRLGLLVVALVAVLVGFVVATSAGLSDELTNAAVASTLVLDVVGVVVSHIAVSLPPLLGRRPARPAVLADEEPYEQLLAEVIMAATRARKSQATWLRMNLLLAGSAAAFSAASGVTGLVATAPQAVRLTFAVLALVGAGLTGLVLSLGAGQRESASDSVATLLERLEREMRFTANRDVAFPRFFGEFQAIMSGEYKGAAYRDTT